MLRRLILVLTAFAIAATPLAAGVKLRAEAADVKSGEITQQTFWIDATRVRVDMQRAKSNNSVIMLLEGDNPRFQMVDHAKGQYMEMDANTMRQAQSQMQGAMAEMQEQLKNMPPQQRAMVEKMMAGRMGMGQAAPRTKTVYTAQGSAKMNGFDCTRFDGAREGTKVSEACASTPAQLGLNPGDFQALEKMREAFADLAKSMANSPFGGNFASDIGDVGMTGFPVHQTTFRDGVAAQKFDIKTVDRASFSDADFSTGSAKKMEMPMGPGARPRR